MLLNILIHRPIYNAAEPVLLTVLERQLKQQVGLSPSCQPWQKKLRKSGNDYVQSQPHVNQKRLKKCSIREPFKLKLFQPNPKPNVLVEMVDPNRTRPWFHKDLELSEQENCQAAKLNTDNVRQNN